MEKHNFKLSGIFFILTLSLHIHGQQYKYKDVSTELLQKLTCEMDTNASAMVTFKSGVREIVYTQTAGFQSILTQQTQVKYFKGDAKTIGNVEIYYYSPKSSISKVKMSGIKGKTYNLENNKIVETKLTDDHVFQLQYNNYYKKATFVIPNIKEGAVFEYEFQLISDFYTNIEDWYIQEKIPVLYNQFVTKIPEYFRYQINVLGGFAPISDEVTTTSKSFNYKVVYESGGGFNSKRETEYKTFNMSYSNRKLVYENIPSFESEPFVANPNDGISKITHQLISVAFPDSPTQSFAGTYEKTNVKLLELESFGKIINDGKFIEKLVSFSDDETQLGKATKIHQYFLKSLQFDGNYSYTTEIGGSKLFKEGKGDVGDINLNYIAALNQVGIPTSPVILSTRGNGTLHPTMPDYAQFNYVVALSQIDGKDVFSDATCTLPFGNLPVICLHDNGWVVSKLNPNWVKLKQSSTGKQIVQTDIIQTTDKLIYASKINKFNYHAFDEINKINVDGDKEYLKSFEKEEDFVQDSISITEKTDKVLKLKENQSLIISDNDIIYVKPFVHLPFESNPFKQNERQTYVDFPFAMEYKFVTNIKMLDGYSYEVPANLNAVMKANDLTLKYITSYIDGIKTLSIVADFKIIQMEFSPLEYEELKLSMEMMINKLNEPVILKKI